MSHQHRFQITLLAALIASACQSQASIEEDIYSDIPQVISATRLSQKQTEAPASITIIDQEKIKASGAINIADLFRLVPGMQVYHVNYNKFGVTYHGMSDDLPKQMEVMIDGRSIYLPLLSTVMWESLGITLEDIDYIEVIRGSNVPAYGSNAFTGAINIVTLSPLTKSGHQVHTLVGANNEMRASYRYVGESSEFNYRISVDHQQNDGEAIYHDDLRKNNVNAAIVSLPDANNSYHFNIGFNQGESHEGGADIITNIYSNREFQSNYQHFNWVHTQNDESEIQLSAHHNYLALNIDMITVEEMIWRQFQDPEAKDSSSISMDEAAFFAAMNGLSGTMIRPDSEHGMTEQYDIELQYSNKQLGSVQYVFGGGYRYERARSDVLFDNNEIITEDKWRLFGNISWWQTKQLLWNTGAMLEKNSLAGSRISPRIAANYQLTGNSSLRAIVTRAYRMPSLLEVNREYNIRKNAENNNEIWDITLQKPSYLKAEKMTNIELGYFQTFTSFDGQLDLRIFRETVKDGINSHFISVEDSLDNYALIYGNGFEWQAKGFEVQFQVEMGHDSLFLFNYNYTDIDNAREYRGLKGYFLRDNSAPDHTASALYSFTLDNGYKIGIADYFVNNTLWREGASGKKPRKAYQRFDLSLSKRWNFGDKTVINGAIIAQNVLNEVYTEFYPNNFFDRRIYIKLDATF